MAGEIVPPTLGAKSFNCPHCSAVAHQTWYKLFMDMYEKDQYPWVPTPDIFQRLGELPREGRDRLREFFQQRLSKMPFIEVKEDGYVHLRNELENTSVSRCYSCDKLALWVADQLVYPHQKYFIAPAAEMPENVRTDF
jgi:hypothetical protein